MPFVVVAGTTELLGWYPRDDNWASTEDWEAASEASCARSDWIDRNFPASPAVGLELLVQYATKSRSDWEDLESFNTV